MNTKDDTPNRPNDAVDPDVPFRTLNHEQFKIVMRELAKLQRCRERMEDYRIALHIFGTGNGVNNFERIMADIARAEGEILQALGEVPR